MCARCRIKKARLFLGVWVGAYLADFAFWFFGYVAYSLPVVLGGMAWIALFGLDSDGDGRVDFGPALRLIGIVGFLSISCFELLQEGVRKLTTDAPSRQATTREIELLAATVLLNLFVVWYERRRGRDLQSAFLMADAAHTVSDVYVTGLAVLSLVLARYGHPRLDAVLAIIVALIIAWTGYRILRETVPILVDQRGADPSELRTAIVAVDGVRIVRAVRSRLTASGTLFAEVTIGVDEDMSVLDAHLLADAVESRIAAAYGVAEVTVHVEPV